MTDDRFTQQVNYRHHFSKEFLYPKYWGVWIGVLILAILAYVPFRLRDKLGVGIGKLVTKYMKAKNKKQYRRSDINLRYCFPDWSQEKREEVIENMFITVSQTMLGIGEIALRSVKHIQKRSEFSDLNLLREAREKGKNIILLVPHTWSIDASGIVLHTYNIPMVSMYNPHANRLVDWLWNTTRERFGGKMHTRQNGIKPFLIDVRKGNMGYFLPDEDYGEELSIYSPFFATEKATLPGLDKMAKITNSVVIPMFPIYNAEKGVYQIEMLPQIEFDGTLEQSAREMNRVIEYFVEKNPEQYVWILRLLKTQRDGKDIYQ
ncbi:lauroyl-Kdo(2)-lipid IV(A) myristoyltransferase [Otariodibacter oris]|uniref:Lipid A biosynthesis acyltransferase n=1 Tax=Otariodibacter oris TaxID=1032623 RepID=A0A420XG43_9PAST|nr:lauroyl-Kdo(2)-lipid IV(A) myristoyltransferase [Otariodibacter oris]QGM80331.1 lipid A biosynthesis (KDO)2-(lauroyl)-lipid IVA acyltransferase [Otariodibacter oris]RKR71699.1 lauroyl-KDO2-lipid IV(A) myristoyltransferase [Otariodibacter oris]